MYWYSDDRSIQFNFNRQKSGLNKAFYGHRSSSVFLTNILKYRLDLQLGQIDFRSYQSLSLVNRKKFQNIRKIIMMYDTRQY